MKLNNIRYCLIVSSFAFMIAVSTGCGKKLILNEKFGPDTPIRPMAGIVPGREFYFREDLGDSLKLIWQEDAHGSFNSTSPVLIGNTIIIADLSGRIHAFRITDGEKVGEIRKKGVMEYAPMLNSHYLYFAVASIRKPESSIIKYDFRQGRSVAEKEFSGKIESEMLLDDKGIIYLNETGKIEKLDYDLNPLWTYDAEHYIHSSAVMVNDRLIFGNDKGEVAALNSSDGKLLYSKKIAGNFTGGFAAYEDKVFASDASGSVFCMNADDGSVLWTYKTSAAITSFPVAAENDALYIGNLKGDLYKLRRSSGKLIWKISTGGVLNATPLVFRDYVVQTDLNKKAYLISTTDGSIKKTLVFEDRVKMIPFFSDNMLILATDRGRIYGYEVIR